MKFNLLIVILLFYSGIIIAENGIYNPKYLPPDSNKYPEVSDLGIAFIHGIIGGLPNIEIDFLKKAIVSTFPLASFVDQAFSIFLGMSGLTPEYMTKDDIDAILDKRLDEVFKGMQIYVDSKIEESIIKRSKIEYDKLYASSSTFRNFQTIFDYEKKHGGVMPDTKEALKDSYLILLNSLKESLIEFGNDEMIEYTSVLYLETALMYALALKDGIDNSVEYGLPRHLIKNSIPSTLTISDELEILGYEVLQKWNRMLSGLRFGNRNIKYGDVNQYYQKKQKPLPDKGYLISAFHYSNKRLYNGTKTFINEQPTKKDYEYYGSEETTNPVLKFTLDQPIGNIYIIDWAFLGSNMEPDEKDDEHISLSQPFYPLTTDYLTGLKGYKTNQNSEFGIRLFFKNTKKISFRFIYSNTFDAIYSPSLKKFRLLTWELNKTSEYQLYDKKYYTTSVSNINGYIPFNARYMLTTEVFDFSNIKTKYLTFLFQLDYYHRFSCVQVITHK